MRELSIYLFVTFVIASHLPIVHYISENENRSLERSFGDEQIVMKTQTFED